jgi:hypothetical protein
MFAAHSQNAETPPGRRRPRRRFSQRVSTERRLRRGFRQFCLACVIIQTDLYRSYQAKMKKKGRRATSGFAAGRKSVLVVLFIPSVQRDGITSIDQESWVTLALEIFGGVFGGTTAYPRARGIWRDDENQGLLVKDEPVIVHCYTTPRDINDPTKLRKLYAFCSKMGRDARQGEIGLVIGDEYFSIRDFTEGS